MAALNNKSFATYILAFIMALSGFGILTANAQIPASLENEIDQFNAEALDALTLLKTQSEQDAVAKLSAIKPKLRAKGESLTQRLNKYPEMSEAEEGAYLQRQMAKPVYSNLMALLSDTEFKNKVSGNAILQVEFDELMAIMDIGADENVEETEESYVAPGNYYCSFEIGSNYVKSGLYSIPVNNEETIGFIDDSGNLTVEIVGNLGGIYISLLLIIDESKAGKYNWNSDGQIYLQGEDDSGNEIIHLQNHQEDGYIIIQLIDEKIVSGSFKGLFFDDNVETDELISVEGKFSVGISTAEY